MAQRPRARSAGGLYPVFVAVFLTAAMVAGFADPFFLKALRFIGFDELQRLNPAPIPSDPAAMVVDIDEESLARVGQWPWSRAKLADLVTRLGEGGAAAVAFDVMFAEPDRTSLEQVLATLPSAQADWLADEAQSWVPNDTRFAMAIAQVPTVLATTLTGDPRAGPAPKAKSGFATAGDDPIPFLSAYSHATANLPALSASAAGVGAINWIPDRDQIVRRVPLLFRVGPDPVPSLAAEALRVAQGASTYLIKASNASGQTSFGQPSGINHVRIGAVEIPTDSNGGLWLHFHKVDRATFIPAWRILEGTVEKSRIEGRIVLIGTSAAGLADLRATPLEEAVPGVAIHQLVLEHILAGKFLTRPDFARAFELGLTLTLGIFLAVVFPFIPAQSAAFIGVATIASLNIGAWWLFAHNGFLFDPLYPSLCLFLLGTSASFYLYRRTEVQRQEIRRAFGRYVSPDVVEELIAHPEKLILGGEVRPLTLLFCDVRGFTKISEGMSATELTSFINRLFTPLSEIVMRHGGTIDKYMGDAIMAFWNAPLDNAHHAQNALEAAADILIEVDALNIAWRKEAQAAGRAYLPVRLGIGVNTGDCCVGNLGSTQRFDYSAIGDEVNVASRFESLTKLYSLPLLTGEATQVMTRDLPLLEVDLVRVKGRDRPSRVYTLLTVFDAPQSRYTAVQRAQSNMLTAYRKGDWKEAEAALEKCRAVGIHELDGLYDLFKARIAAYKIAPPPAGWNGVYTAEEK